MLGDMRGDMLRFFAEQVWGLVRPNLLISIVGCSAELHVTLDQRAKIAQVSSSAPNPDLVLCVCGRQADLVLLSLSRSQRVADKGGVRCRGSGDGRERADGGDEEGCRRPGAADRVHAVGGRGGPAGAVGGRGRLARHEPH
eukprot:763414-Rhodomonas_salina.1